MNAGKRIVSILLALVMAVGVLAAGEAALASDPLKGLSLDPGKGVIRWDAVPGADSYDLVFSTYSNTLTYERDTASATLPSFGAKAFLDGAPHRSGSYTVTVEAMDSKTGTSLARGTVEYVGYVSPFPQLSAPQAVWSRTTLKWDPVTMATRYLVTVCFGDTESSLDKYTSVTVESTSVDLSGIIQADRYYAAYVKAIYEDDPEAEFRYTNSPDCVLPAVKGGLLMDDYQTPLTISGGVALDAAYPAVGSTVYARLSGQAVKYEDALTYLWQRSEDGKIWTDLENDAADPWSYVIGSDDVGARIRVRVTAKNYTGFLQSAPCQPVKAACAAAAAKPELQISDGALFVTNGRQEQEYLIFSEFRAPDALTEEDWKAAVSPETSAAFPLEGKADAMNYVYTRVKATDVALAGTDHPYGKVYFGAADGAKDISLTWNDLSGPVTGSSVVLGDKLRITASPVPYDANGFEGIPGSGWLIGGEAISSEYGSFFSDTNCTAPLEADTLYKVVYLVLDKTANNVEVAALSADVGSDRFLLNVSDNRGHILLDSVDLADVTMQQGESMGGLALNPAPADASLDELRLEPAGEAEGAPSILINKVYGTITVNAADAAPGEYVFEARIDRAEEPIGSFKVTVTEKTVPVEAVTLSHDALSLTPGASMSLKAVLSPVDATDTVVWASSNPDVVSVTEDGGITVSIAAKPGKTAAVTASSGGLSAACLITVTEPLEPSVPVVLFTEDSKAEVGGKCTVDIDQMAGMDPELAAAVRKKAVKYQWYNGDEPISGATGATLRITEAYSGAELHVVVTYGSRTLTSETLSVPAVTINPFKDVGKKAYYYDAVMWAVGADPQITNGTTETTFSPKNPCTRGQVVTFLWRAAGCPKPKNKTNPFTDVKEDAYYYEAVLWAVEQKITNGTSVSTFSPERGCTRGQVVTFLHRFEDLPESQDAKNPFTDVSRDAYYYDAVLWAVSADPQITNGTSDTTFSPDSVCTRGQIVTFLYRDLGMKPAPEEEPPAEAPAEAENA